MNTQTAVITIGPLKLNREACKKCGVCVDLCPRQVFTTGDDGCPNPTNIERCTECKLCELWCPDYAIEVGVSRHES